MLSMRLSWSNVLQEIHFNRTWYVSGIGRDEAESSPPKSLNYAIRFLGFLFLVRHFENEHAKDCGQIKYIRIDPWQFVLLRTYLYHTLLIRYTVGDRSVSVVRPSLFVSLRIKPCRSVTIRVYPGLSVVNPSDSVLTSLWVRTGTVAHYGIAHFRSNPWTIRP
jgi:hypothetical protein